jgi:NADP-dependent aldehyde dehydrogenase
MGSLNPVVILPGAISERGDSIAAGLAQSITNGAGQFCTKPGWIFVTAGSATDTFLAQLANAMSAVPAATMLTAAMRNNFCNITGGFRKIPGVKTLLDNVPTGFAAISPLLLEVDSNTWRSHAELHEEAFGPGAVIVRCRDLADLRATISHAEGNLTAALHAGPADSAAEVRALAQTLEQRAGRVIFNGYPTGVEVGHAMVHGGPYPATTAPATSSVGALAIRRFVRPVAYQNVPDDLRPPELQNANPLGIWRTVNGEWTRRAL